MRLPWHISLSTWFRDYLYIPLGGNRVGRGRWYFNLMAVFVISGLWHGANWTFVVWGTLHGMFMVVEAATAGVWGAVGHKVGWYRLPGRVRELVQMALIFHLVCFGWIFFRAKSIGDALTLVRGLAGFRWEQFAHPGAYGLPAMELGILAAAILAMEAGQVVFRGRSASAWLADQPRPLRWAVYYGLVMVLLMFGEFAGAQQFIYFQF